MSDICTILTSIFIVVFCRNKVNTQQNIDFVALRNKSQPVKLPPLLRPADREVDAGGFDAGMA